MTNISMLKSPKVLTNYGFIAPKKQRKLTQSQTIIILETLQTSLDISDLLQNFAAIAAQYIRFSGLIFSSANNNIALKEDSTPLFQQNFNLAINNQELGCFLYSSDEPLKISELAIIKELHQLLLANLMHALKFQGMQQRILKDHLTGLDNRASFDENIQRSYSLCQRHKSNMALLLTDLNNFKRINDTYGHQFGDKVLQRFAHVLQRSIRSSDVAFRLGGDEFALILQPASEQSTATVIRRIHAEIAKDSLLGEFGVSSAIGSAMWRSGETIESLFKQADEDLYKSKFNH